MHDVLIDGWDDVREADAFLFHVPARKAMGEGDSFEFYREELRLAKVLGMAEAGAANAAVRAFRRATDLDTPKPVARKAARIDLEKAVESLDPIMRTAWDSKTEAIVSDLVSAITAKGAKRAGNYQAFRVLKTRPSIEAGMVASAKYSTNTYFNRVVMPSMIGDIREKMRKDGEFDDQFFRAMQKKLETRLKSVPYWKNVASQASSRAYHYGLTRAGLQKGYTGYRLQAVLDERTSAVCEQLHGKQFWLETAVAHAEKVALMDPEDAIKADPWATPEMIEGKSNGELAKAGVMLPPFHFGGCRTTIELIR